MNKEKKEKGDIYKNPKNFADITQSIFGNTGFRDPDFVGYTDERGFNEAKWKKKNLTALVPTKDLSLLDPSKKQKEGQGYLLPTPPKIAVSQAKNIDTLLVLLEKQNRKRDKTGQDRLGDLEFSMKDYARIRGKSETQLARGGNFINELKRDLISGGITSYVIEKEKSFIINNFYGIELPKAKSRGNWKVFFNEPYRTYILNNKQYYPILLQAIQDKNTDDRKGYIYFFFKLVMSYANTSKDFKTQLKISTLLDKIHISDRVKERPPEAFSVLAECIYYVASQYKAIKEVRFFNNGKCEKVKVITDLDTFKDYDYDTFIKDVLTPLGLTDIRDALISFNIPTASKHKEETEIPEQTGQDRTTL
jgi:hypothetical protein